MDDKQVDGYITKRIKKRGITLYDIIGGKYIDQTPDAIEPPPGQRTRRNRFSCPPLDLRLCELFAKKRFDPEDPYRNPAVPLKDLVRYWWNNCVEQETVLVRYLRTSYPCTRTGCCHQRGRKRGRMSASLLTVFWR